MKPQISNARTEGMWLPDALPVERLQRDFDFRVTAAWAEHLRLASVHIGASGAFVSPDGLVLTNHHVAVNGLQNISRPGKDYVTNGFLAKSRDEEIPLPGMELSVLVSIQDVTADVNAAVDPHLSNDEAVKARHAVFANLESESLHKTGLHSRVITLYGGARYDLYRYKRYSDVRVVFAPEVATAFFGGDPDNFEYPRYDLDIAILRAYENGKPARVEHYLKLSAQGVSDGDLIFVSGHPGRTDRLLPVSALQFLRDMGLPLRLELLEQYEKTVVEYAARGPEEHRQAQEEIFGIQNSLKAMRPQLAALRGDLITRKQEEETAIRTQLRARPYLQHFDAAWDRAAAVEPHRAELLLPYTFLERGQAFETAFFYYARELVRLAAEDEKPDDQRLPEYTQAKREPLEHGLFADEPVYANLEIAKLTESLEMFRKKLGSESPVVQKVLAGLEPAARGEQLVRGTKLGDPAERRRIRDGGQAAIEGSTDPMIQLARLVDDDSRKLRQSYESQVDEPLTQALTLINQARFAVLGSSAYPDATGTLRLAYGVVKGYEQDGQSINPWTTFGGAFAHEREHGAKPPFLLPASWHRVEEHLNAKTPLDFVCTADITGGNSGSPVVNRHGELVGVIFDSNRQGLVDTFTYSDAQARAVCVDSRAIIEALRHIYSTEGLLKELLGDSNVVSHP
jgi:hypothetical protein